MSEISIYRSLSLTPLAESFTVDQLNSSLESLQDSVRFLSSVMEIAREGSALWGFNATIQEGITVGQPVYYNVANERFELSYIDVVLVGGLYVAGPSSDVWGIVGKLCADDKAHILLDGIASIDLTASAGSSSPPGKFYLSTVAGELVDTPNDKVIAPVLLCTGDSDILFRPWFADNYARYSPKIIRIEPEPAADTINDSGSVTTLAALRPDDPGWLPAGHSVFGGTAPTGARFGYNWTKDDGLKDLWPPVYPNESKLLIDQGTEYSQGYKVLLSADPNRLVIDASGIWWMTDRTGQLPWDMPIEYDTTAPAGTLNPRDYARQLAVEASFSQDIPTVLQNVYSLATAIPWLKVRLAGTNTDATRGDLELQISDSDFAITDPPDVAGLAFKQLSDGKLTQGPAVAGLKAGTSNITLAGDQDADDYYVGRVTLNVTASKDFDLLPLRRQLFGATNESYQDVMATGLPASKDTSFVVEFHVPHSIPSSSEVRFYITLLAPATINLPSDLTTELMRIPADAGSPLALPTYGPLVLNYTPGETITAGYYVTISTDIFEVSGGDVLYLKMSRSGSTDGEGGLLNVLRHVGRFE